MRTAATMRTAAAMGAAAVMGAAAASGMWSGGAMRETAAAAEMRTAAATTRTATSGEMRNAAAMRAAATRAPAEPRGAATGCRHWRAVRCAVPCGETRTAAVRWPGMREACSTEPRCASRRSAEMTSSSEPPAGRYRAASNAASRCTGR
jgi:hypothetical protein